jgi:crotonobetainyl-CoA:carnitine CoA-transferase CaiB-like acyl-CoA transferase
MRTRRPPLPLAGIRVLDLSRILAGPFCTMRLGDLGADVIKIEQPGSGDETRRWGPPFIKGESAYYLSINRNKRSVTLDLASREGRAVLRKLIATSDVLVENFRAGVMKNFGFDYARARKINPRLIYCSITGYGQQSAKSHRPSYDLIVQAESGLMDLTGFPDGPPTKVGISLCDINAAMLALTAITTALYRRALTGDGARIDIGLLDATLSLLAFQSQIALCSDQPVSRLGNLHPTLVPYQVYRTKDGSLTVAVVSDAIWGKFCRAIGSPSLAADPRFATNARRVRNRRALAAILEPVLRARTTGSWTRTFARADVPAGRIRTVREALREEPSIVTTIRHPHCGRLPSVRFPDLFRSGGTLPMGAPPRLGEHTAEVLDALGYTRKEVAQLRTRSIV